jgi:hypothetical protein
MNGQDLEPRDEALERRARAAFEASVAGLDEDTRSRLRAARHAAVARLASRRRSAWRAWAPVAIAASAALVAVLLWRAPAELPHPVASSGAAESMEELEMVAAGDDLDLVAEDIEFYAWLEQATVEAGAGGQG